MEARFHNRGGTRGGIPSCLRVGDKEAFRDWGFLTLVLMDMGIFWGKEGRGGEGRPPKQRERVHKGIGKIGHVWKAARSSARLKCKAEERGEK